MGIRKPVCQQPTFGLYFLIPVAGAELEALLSIYEKTEN